MMPQTSSIEKTCMKMLNIYAKIYICCKLFATQLDDLTRLFRVLLGASLLTWWAHAIIQSVSRHEHDDAVGRNCLHVLKYLSMSSVLSHLAFYHSFRCENRANTHVGFLTQIVVSYQFFSRKLCRQNENNILVEIAFLPVLRGENLRLRITPLANEIGKLTCYRRVSIKARYDYTSANFQVTNRLTTRVKVLFLSEKFSR